jgi:hypothetical protein
MGVDRPDALPRDDSGTWPGDRGTNDVQCDTCACPFKRCCNRCHWAGTHVQSPAEQVGSIDVRRLGPRIGQLPPAVIAELDKALRLHLSL